MPLFRLYILILSFFYVWSCESTQPESVYGCTDENACNYDIDANIFDNSCIYDFDGDGYCDDTADKNYGCTDPDACNYDPSVDIFDNSCFYEESLYQQGELFCSCDDLTLLFDQCGECGGDGWAMCDSDQDNIPNINDGYPLDPNNDTDSDGLASNEDNCPNTANTNQEDSDSDGYGDACDFCPFDSLNHCDECIDNDNDGACNSLDRCETYNDNLDQDSDGIPDGCDICPEDELNVCCADLDDNGLCDHVDSYDETKQIYVSGSSSQDFVINSEFFDFYYPQLRIEIEGDFSATDKYANIFIEDDFLGKIGDGYHYSCEDIVKVFNIDRNDFNSYKADGIISVSILVSNEVSNGGCDDNHTYRLVLSSELQCLSGEDDDNDEICDELDICPNDINNDIDGDGICDCTINDQYNCQDEIDSCPNDAENDIDNDGICGDVDECPYDVANDSDDDGVCGDVDICSGFDDNIDNDQDSVPDGCDLCPGYNDNLDDDGDGVPNDCDICPGFDDTVDTDSDGAPDNCDVCVLDAENDADGDGICGDIDLCPYDAENDVDGDGICGDIDLCPYDAENDVDGDGYCADVDNCPYDAENDADGDGVCGDVDMCPGFDDNIDSDYDGDPDGCDLCPDDPQNDCCTFESFATFTNCGSVGNYGPTQSDCNSEYENTDLEGKVTIAGNGIQIWTVPISGTYTIEAWGAQGGNDGGPGAQIQGEFYLSQGDMLHILVGQIGEDGGDSGGGGGGTFVVMQDDTPLIISGGGGGKDRFSNVNGTEGLTSSQGGYAQGSYPNIPGDNGSGSSGGGGAAGGGGGFLSPSTGYEDDAYGYLQGGVGAPSSTCQDAGGFGGGGHSDRCNGYDYGGGGGGGYSGGAGAGCNGGSCGGGGGGSYNGGAFQENFSGTNYGDGYVIILCPSFN